MAKAKGKRCFVIAPVGAPKSPTHRRSNQVFDFLVKPVVETMGYRAVRADKQATPGIITHQIINDIVEAPLVVADLSDGNGNAFYELAIRHVTQKPLVQLIIEGQEIPFDVRTMRTVFYDMTDPYKIEEAKEELKRHVEAAERGEPIETPISAALDLRAYKSSENTVERALAEIVSDVADLRAELRASRGAYFSIGPSFVSSGRIAPSQMVSSQFIDPAAFTTLSPAAFTVVPTAESEESGDPGEESIE